MISINVAGLLREPPGIVRHVKVRDRYINLGPDLELAGPLDVDLRLQRTNRGILVRGAVQASMRRSCSRCTDAFVEPIAVELDEEFLPSIDPHSGAPVEVKDDEPGRQQWIDEHHEVVLDAVLHDELALTEPMHPLCRPDCPGLCVDCGERLDAGEHAHGGEEIDPRLVGLSALLVDVAPDDLRN